jgi:putative intracellular protease/amidase
LKENADVGKKILQLVGDYVEDHEVMAPFQMLTMVGHTVHSVCPDKKAGAHTERDPKAELQTARARPRLFRSLRGADCDRRATGPWSHDGKSDSQHDSRAGSRQIAEVLC